MEDLLDRELEREGTRCSSSCWSAVVRIRWRSSRGRVRKLAGWFRVAGFWAAGFWAAGFRAARFRAAGITLAAA